MQKNDNLILVLIVDFDDSMFTDFLLF